MNPGQIRGTSKYVEDYSAAGFDMDEGHNFIAFKVTAADGATITTEAIGGEHGEKTLDSDGIVITQLTDSVTGIKVKASKGGIVETKTFFLAVTKEDE